LLRNQIAIACRHIRNNAVDISGKSSSVELEVDWSSVLAENILNNIGSSFLTNASIQL
jgi:hypothetical protein